jgi:alpha-1,2-mannosyltransferase
MITIKGFIQKLTPMTRNLCIFFSINLFFSLSSLPFTAKFLLLKSVGTDSWMPMMSAFNLSSTYKDSLYSYLFFEARTKFQYPLTSLIPINILNHINHKATLVSSIDVLNLISWILLATMLAFVIKIFNLSMKNNLASESEDFSSANTIVRTIILVYLILSFYPVFKAYGLGQIQVWLNAFFTISFWLWMKKREHIAGIIVSMMFLIKPQFLIVGIWGILVRKWSFVFFFFSLSSFGIIISILLYGINNNLEYLKVLSYISRHGEVYYPNQSINGLLNRLFLNGSSIKWTASSFPNFNIYVYIGTLIGSIVLISIAFYYSINLRERGQVIDLAIISLSCTMASPVAWEHHYGILLPIYAFLLPSLVKKPIFNKMTFPLLGLTYIVSSNHFSFLNRFANIPILNILQSSLFISSLIVLIYLYKLRKGKNESCNNLNELTLA